LRRIKIPNYEFKNTETGEIYEKRMSYVDLDQYLIDNTNHVRYHSSTPGLGDGMRMDTPGTGKPDSTFEKYIIQRMKETIPGNTMGGHKTKSPREW
jgi:hypothetical protein